MIDDEIYQGIGKILVAIAPPEAQEVIVEAELSLEKDHCKLFDYIAEKGEKQWFMPKTAKVDSDPLDLLVRLRSFLKLQSCIQRENHGPAAQ
ncbi:hypothetical protein [Pseudomonas viridiflava]|uniref:hypothetical protein n=1 Tax=Pseudomonas viridiflava TaxID=33069 RepID=UPI0017814B40|nr:hypothetical protein [Pseudomonas viridiflava]MBD8189832.1 hypothetical protein [Pseudomonas viridiflava]MBD8204643.1 hypothetical protein [Pseudomonas viridiflava]